MHAMMTRSQPGPGDCAGGEAMRAIEMVSRNERVLGGAPVFANTRVLVRTLFDYLEAGDSLDRFLEHFPNVSREQAIAVIEEAKDRVLADSA